MHLQESQMFDRLPSGENGMDSGNSRVQTVNGDCPSLHVCASEFQKQYLNCLGKLPFSSETPVSSAIDFGNLA